MLGDLISRCALITLMYQSDSAAAHSHEEHGDIVAALLDDEATVKTFRQRDGHTWLLPQNTRYEPILGDHATVMGKVVSVLRSL